MITDQFVGTWLLSDAEFRRSDGQIVYPLGKELTGLIIYDSHRYFTAQLLGSHRPAFASGDRERGTLEELKAAFKGYIGYFGTYTINEAEAYVVHHVQGSAFPNWEGGDQIRYYEFDTDTLILKTSPLTSGGNAISAKLTWRRVTTHP